MDAKSVPVNRLFVSLAKQEGQRCHVCGPTQEAIKRCYGDPQYCVPFLIRTRLVTHKLRAAGGSFPASVPEWKRGQAIFQANRNKRGHPGRLCAKCKPLEMVQHYGGGVLKLGFANQFQWFKFLSQQESLSLQRTHLIFETSKRAVLFTG